MIEEQKAEAQQALDEPFGKHLLPFELFARTVESIGRAEYMVSFYDSRLQCFKDSFRDTVFGVKNFSGPDRLSIKTAAA
jgi:hypothetical protein